MKENLLTFLVLLAATVIGIALAACTGGALTDSNDNPMVSTGGSYTVSFENTATGETFFSTVDDDGYFGFDYYAPSGGSNNHVIIPNGTYQIAVRGPAPIAPPSGGSNVDASPPEGDASVTYDTPYAVQQTYVTANCPDHYTGGQDQYCSLYQLKILPPGVAATAPYTSTLGTLPFTVVPLALSTSH